MQDDSHFQQWQLCAELYKTPARFSATRLPSFSVYDAASPASLSFSQAEMARYEDAREATGIDLVHCKDTSQRKTAIEASSESASGFHTHEESLSRAYFTGQLGDVSARVPLQRLLSDSEVRLILSLHRAWRELLILQGHPCISKSTMRFCPRVQEEWVAARQVAVAIGYKRSGWLLGRWRWR